jgi:hypothetical protein
MHSSDDLHSLAKGGALAGPPTSDTPTHTGADAASTGPGYHGFRRLLVSRLCAGLADGRMENCRGLLQALLLYPPQPHALS